MQCCEGCAKLAIDVDLLRDGLVSDKCTEFNYHVSCPLLSGWKCPYYQSKRSEGHFSLLKTIKEKFFNK